MSEREEFEVWQAAKESSRKELEEAKQRIVELEESTQIMYDNSVIVALEKEALEKKVANMLCHVENYASEMADAKLAGFETAQDLLTSYQAMEKKLAGQQAFIAKVVDLSKVYGCSPRWENLRSLINVQGELNLRVQAFRELGKYCASQGTEELAKLLAAERQAGRDDMSTNKEQELQHRLDEAYISIASLKTRLAEAQTVVDDAMKKSWHLVQVYWQQADSEYTSQHKKAETSRRHSSNAHSSTNPQGGLR